LSCQALPQPYYRTGSTDNCSTNPSTNHAPHAHDNDGYYGTIRTTSGRRTYRTLYIEPPEVRVETVEWPVESTRTSAPRKWKYSLLATTVSDREWAKGMSDLLKSEFTSSRADHKCLSQTRDPPYLRWFCYSRAISRERNGMQHHSCGEQHHCCQLCFVIDENSIATSTRSRSLVLNSFAIWLYLELIN